METFRIPSPAGHLEAVLQEPEAAVSGWAAVVCHPHPRYGGTFLNKVVVRTAEALRTVGLPVLRFNFRGVGDSSGVHDEGRGEVEDLRAAADHALRATGAAHLLLAGYSFGAWVGLRAMPTVKGARFFLAVGLPAAVYDFGFLRGQAFPAGFIQGTRDAFGNPESIRDLVRDAGHLQPLEIIPGADHAFTGKLPQLQAAVQRLAACRTGPGPATGGGCA